MAMPLEKPMCLSFPQRSEARMHKELSVKKMTNIDPMLGASVMSRPFNWVAIERNAAKLALFFSAQ